MRSTWLCGEAPTAISSALRKRVGRLRSAYSSRCLRRPTAPFSGACRSFPHMLDVMRSNARSSLIVLIFGAIIVSFIFSFGRGSSGFRTRTPETWAATVNGDLVTAGDFAQAYATRFRQAAAQRGGKYTTDNAKQDDLRRATLKSLVDQELIAQQADDLGVVVTDQELSDS